MPAVSAEPTTVFHQLRQFNELYDLPRPAYPVLQSREAFVQQLRNFRTMLTDELGEGEDIEFDARIPALTDAELLTSVADWLGDLAIYSLTEMLKYGLDPQVVLSTIMASNMSKLGKDGMPIKNEIGKVMKGPDYWPPEPMLHQYIKAAVRQGQQGQDYGNPNNPTGTNS